VFGAFLAQLAAHFSTSEFEVHIWEIGNEPDVDPNVVPLDSVFGCWGNTADPYFGGEHYGEMIKVVSPMVKAADPKAQIWIGGLLLDSPLTTDPAKGKPELFFEGILKSGAAPHFDAVPYHWYPHFTTRQRIDFDLNPNNVWYAWGGGVAGKARFLRETMERYGVSKPIYLNETALICRWCKEDAYAQLFQAQADFAIRSYLRGFQENIQGYMWYPVEGPGWLLSGFLDAQGNQKPVYRAYKFLHQQTLNTPYLGPVNYGAPFEGYTFNKGTSRLEVVWTVTDNPATLLIPQAKFAAVYDTQGNPLIVTTDGGNVLVPVGFSPVFILRSP
jgi:hypothetical protein